MDLQLLLIYGGSFLAGGFILYLLLHATGKPLTVFSYTGQDKNNPDILHVFGAVTYIPDDRLAYNKYVHYILNTSDLKIKKGLEQIGSGFDIKSPFAIRCLERMRKTSGLNLEFGKEFAENDLKVIEHQRNESDTIVGKEAKGNVIEYFDNSVDKIQKFSLTIRLDGKVFSISKRKGANGLYRVVYRKEKQKLFIFYNRMQLIRMGVGLLIVDTNTGQVLHDGYFGTKRW
jgi:hypothetical protein